MSGKTDVDMGVGKDVDEEDEYEEGPIILRKIESMSLSRVYTWVSRAALDPWRRVCSNISFSCSSRTWKRRFSRICSCFAEEEVNRR